MKVKDVFWSAGKEEPFPGSSEEYKEMAERGERVLAIIRCDEGGLWGGGALHLYKIKASGEAEFTPHQNLPELGWKSAPVFATPEELARWFIETGEEIENVQIRWTELA